jgi:uroporphyrin-3 C-methyltransferase
VNEASTNPTATGPARTDDQAPAEPADNTSTADKRQAGVAHAASGGAAVSIGLPPAWVLPALVLVALLALAGVWLGWTNREQSHGLERELVRRVQVNTEHADEARLVAKQSQDTVRETAAKLALLEARLAEVALQRTQLEDLIQSLSRSRDENAVADIDASIRVAVQQSAITGSAEPLVAALRSADERLSRINQPRLQGVRRALARDIDRLRAVSAPELGSLLIKFDEAVRLLDDLPLQSNAYAVARSTPATPTAASAPGRPAPASAPASTNAPAIPWRYWLDEAGAPLAKVWQSVRDLVRVRRIDTPEAMLLAPEQAYFLRENVKLRLLNARLALLSRQAETAQADLQAVITALQMYFDASARRTQVALELLRQVQAQSRQAVLPRPDETLAAIAALANR